MKAVYVKKGDLNFIQEFPAPDDLAQWYVVSVPDDFSVAGKQYDPLANSWSVISYSAPVIRRISKVAFRNRFTLAEKVDIYTAAKTDPMVQIMMDDIAAVTTGVDLDFPSLSDGLGYLVQLGILTAERAAAMRADGSPSEV
ncbi:MAG: hypothetical protein II007_13365 [Gammaproteobacteria bacterium]|nr:hypothetical protein [Gammaproteobacteria bacterium]